jgi:hypothetical protein
MSENRSSYVNVLPLVFLFGLMFALLNGLQDYLTPANRTGQRYLEVIIVFTKSFVIMMCIGVAFRRMKAAVISLGVFILLPFIFWLLAATGLGKKSFQTLLPLFVNDGLTLLVFGFICFKKAGLRYFVPLWLLSLAIFMLHTGTQYLDLSPYNNWYRLLSDDPVKIKAFDGSYRSLKLLSYTFQIALPVVMVILAGECYIAASHDKRWRGLFHIDLSTNYSKAGAITLFISLRLLINMLVIGLFAYPYTHFYNSGRLFFRSESFLVFLLSFAGGLALLIFVVRYYRRFMVEYFISIRQKIQWLFWLVNTPIIGLLVFPFVVLIARRRQRDSNRFFFTEARHNLQPFTIAGGMLGISFISALALGDMSRNTEMFWYLWLAEAALFIWYVRSITGYYVILGFALLGLIIYLAKLEVEGRAFYGLRHYITLGPESYRILLRESITYWILTAFHIVQYAVLLPVFHLDEMKAVQENVEEEEKISNVEYSM